MAQEKLSSSKSPLVGDLLVLIAMAIFATYALFLRSFANIPVAVFLISFQVVGAFASILIAVLQKEKFPPQAAWKLLLALAFVASANDLCYFFSFRMTTIANAELAHQMVSCFVAVLAPLLLQEKTLRSEWLALAFSLAGIGVLYSDKTQFSRQSDLAGISLALLSALFYALLIVLYRKLNQLHIRLSVINASRYLISILMVSPLLCVSSVWTPGFNDLVILLSFGLLFAVLASFMHNYAMSLTRALHVSVIGKTEPVFAIICAGLFLHEPVTMPECLGGLLILGSTLWLATQRDK